MRYCFNIFLLQDFCPLKINITQFPGGFHLKYFAKMFFLFTLPLMFCLFAFILAENLNVSISDTKLWDIMAEVVKLCMYPSPLNPFAVDFKYFEGLPLAQRVIATGAMAHFLQKVVASGDHAYNARGTLLFNHFHHSEHNALSLPLVARVGKKIKNSRSFFFKS